MIEEGLSNVVYFRTNGGSSKLYTQEYVDKKDKEIERLNNIINKAIEYMNDTIDFSWKDNSPIKIGKSLSLNKLLDILKGE